MTSYICFIFGYVYEQYISYIYANLIWYITRNGNSDYVNYAII